MQVILLEKINHLGDLGAIVKVKDGYARNFLIPQGHASVRPRLRSKNSKLAVPNSNACRLNVSLRLRKRLKSSTAR